MVQHGFEPQTSRTLSENHTPRPTSQMMESVTTATYVCHFAYSQSETTLQVMTAVYYMSQISSFLPML